MRPEAPRAGAACPGSVRAMQDWEAEIEGARKDLEGVADVAVVGVAGDSAWTLRLQVCGDGPEYVVTFDAGYVVHKDFEAPFESIQQFLASVSPAFRERQMAATSARLAKALAAAET